MITLLLLHSVAVHFLQSRIHWLFLISIYLPSTLQSQIQDMSLKLLIGTLMCVHVSIELRRGVCDGGNP